MNKIINYISELLKNLTIFLGVIVTFFVIWSHNMMFYMSLFPLIYLWGLLQLFYHLRMMSQDEHQ